jgi:hypothetical protein
LSDRMRYLARSDARRFVPLRRLLGPSDDDDAQDVPVLAQARFRLSDRPIGGAPTARFCTIRRPANNASRVPSSRRDAARSFRPTAQRRRLKPLIHQSRISVSKLSLRLHPAYLS